VLVAVQFPSERPDRQLMREQARKAAEALPPIPMDAPYGKLAFQRGVNFTAEGPHVYASVGAQETLRRLPEFGVNAIALVPYAGARPGETSLRRFGANSMESDEGLQQLSRLAHHLGLTVLLKPQLWVRGGGPMSLAFDDPAARAAWFAEYTQFIEYYAQLARRIHADLFCVGVELSALAQHEAEWRALIARVRAIYPGPLVYAANFGEEFESLRFWDALDYIGLDNYYPLPDDFSAAAIVKRVHAVQKKFRRPVIFTEAGFASIEGAHRQPWVDRNGAVSLETQARGYEAIFRAFYRQKWLAGIYWWKVGSSARGGPDDRTHSPWGKPAMDVLRHWYTNGKR
jgi:hypothetical protein